MDFNNKTLRKVILLTIGYIFFSIGFGLFSSKIDYGFSSSILGLLAILLLGALLFGSVLWTLFTLIFGVLSIIIKQIRKYRRKVILLFLILWLVTMPLFISYKFFSIGVAQKTYNSSNLIMENLEEYKKDDGKYPENLTLLMPKYLKEIPKTGKGNEFQYQTDGKSYYLYFFEDFGTMTYDTELKNWTYHD